VREFLRFTMQMQMRHSILIAPYLNLQPANSADAATQRLRYSLLCGKPYRKRRKPAAAIALFVLGKNPCDKPFSVMLDRITNAGDFD
jgi:hypothetical protein